MKKTIFKIETEMFPFTVILSIASDNSELIEYLSKYICDEDLDYFKEVEKTPGRSLMFSNGITLLFLRDDIKLIKDLALLQHEIFHCACFILEKVGIEYCDSSSEAYAYFIELLTNKIYKEIDIKFK
ncbi:MAG: hypothetical protein GY849_02275 [Deltaproteobacteria bacterium]|nr:hypothetical protein [Deltaproteobacteria bacterium]